ncbi:calcium-binding protein [Leptolyngbya sp. NK1-12]|uniref:Calcium-binding protein n=1 Tax=Leptolyngbya sp. NK1-12 TaxID=2547451 RepID=A0AA97AK72_9CYAN|nr:calcium-binding protein [Leptolyngbya sp. NK1-12]WNZ27479.1 calcium-binding protein [Leptolyngbya sp. NK1-12]
MSQRAGNNLKTALKANIVGSSRVFRDAVSGKPDFYSFQLGHSSSFSLKLNRFKADINVALMDGQGQMLMQSARAKRRPEAIDTVLGAGTYYVKVFPARRREQSRYRLQLSATELPRIVEPPPVIPIQDPPPVAPIQDPPNDNSAPPEPLQSDSGKSKQIALTGDVASTGPVNLVGTVNRRVIGTIGNETLVGGAGDDLIAGINGFDLLIGGGGADRFLLGDTSTPYYLGVGYAVITDFNVAQGDRIEVTDNALFRLGDHRLVYDRFFIPNAFGQYRDVGTAGIDTAIYWGNDLLAIVQDAVVT